MSIVKLQFKTTTITDHCGSAETISTRFLCVSTADASFPIWDWKAMTGREETLLTDPDEKAKSTFVGRTTAWDSFVVYGIDPSKVASCTESDEERAPSPNGLPHPPAYALPVPAAGFSLPIYYNQPIILQSVNTGVVSPVMVIRRIDTDSMAMGGASLSTGRPALDVPSAPGESLGGPVGQ